MFAGERTISTRSFDRSLGPLRLPIVQFCCPETEWAYVAMTTSGSQSRCYWALKDASYFKVHTTSFVLEELGVQKKTSPSFVWNIRRYKVKDGDIADEISLIRFMEFLEVFKFFKILENHKDYLNQTKKIHIFCCLFHGNILKFWVVSVDELRILQRKFFDFVISVPLCHYRKFSVKIADLKISNDEKIVKRHLEFLESWQRV